jgi:SAM-dependent methyltransferase
MNMSTPEEIQQLATAFQKSRILLTALELDLFTALGGDARTSEEVAGMRSTDPRGTDRLLNALSAMGLIRKEKGLFSNTPAAAGLLVRGAPGYMAGLMHVAGLWKTWSTLTDAVRKGGRVADPLRERSPVWFRDFIAAMHHRAERSAADSVGRLDLTGISRVLDVGGGSGAFSIAFVRSRPGITATVFDLPIVAPLAREYVDKAGLGDRIEIIEGDFHTDALGTGYDLVYFSAIVHMNSPEQNRALMEKAHSALKPGGGVAIQDFIMAENRTEPPFGALFALNMLVGTDAGDTYTAEEAGEWLAGAGFVDIRSFPGPEETAFVTGRKPDESTA